MIRTLPALASTLVFIVACSSTSSAPSGGGGTGGNLGTGGASGGAGGNASAGASGGAGAGLSGAGGALVGAGGTAASGAGTGGAQASAGSAGTTGTAGSAATGCAGMPLCDDFEAAADAVGAAPQGWTLVNAKGCSGSADYSAAVDTTQFHSGTKSIKVTGGDSCGPMLVNTAAFASLTGGEVYGRFFVRMPSTTAFDHAVMMALGLTANADANGMGFDQAKHLAFAPEQIGTTSALVWQTTDSNILPAKSPNAASSTTFPKADTWTCVEFHVSANTKAIETWIDGTVVPGMTFIPGTTAANQEVNGQWTPAALAPTSFGLGWVVFSAPSISLWFDDAALGTKRIGCN